MKYTIYMGIETDNLTHGAEYPIVKNVEVLGKLFGRYILDNNGNPYYISAGNVIPEFEH